MKKKLLFLLLICSQFLFSQKKILLFSPESYQYKVQSEFVKKNKVNTITVFYQHEFVKGNHLDENLREIKTSARKNNIVKNHPRESANKICENLREIKTSARKNNIVKNHPQESARNKNIDF